MAFFLVVVAGVAYRRPPALIYPCWRCSARSFSAYRPRSDLPLPPKGASTASASIRERLEAQGGLKPATLRRLLI